MSEAIYEDPFTYASYNDFFTRKLKPNLRPIADTKSAVVSPVDATVHSFGLNTQELLAVKGEEYSIAKLLADDTKADLYQDGSHMVLYLAPHNYHRIHMPYDGILTKTVYVPGKLFSVNPKQNNFCNSIFARNERLVCYFDTDKGRIVVILVAAMVVGQIETTWGGVVQPAHSLRKIEHNYSSGIKFKKGDDIARFRLGSTVVMLTENALLFDDGLEQHKEIKMGSVVADNK